MDYAQAQRELLALRHILQRARNDGELTKLDYRPLWDRFLGALATLHQLPRAALDRQENISALPFELGALVVLQYENNSWLQKLFKIAPATIASSQLIGSDRGIHTVDESEIESSVTVFLEQLELQINLQFEA
ncbi:hypothetical protein [uncultured Umboniibacter sp.]|uniref:hypothetical protein n=1 Tax=uncultured Umboniibacter sp. TaxID=1798917 RepID=UPI00262CE537|nr:hypothetical protein [uncultured Umboniibacter sp.]